AAADERPGARRTGRADAPRAAADPAGPAAAAVRAARDAGPVAPRRERTDRGTAAADGHPQVRNAMRHHLPLLALTLAVAAGAAYGQSASVTERQRLIELRNKQVGQPGFLELPKAPGHNFDVGGWVTVANLDLRDDDHSKITPDTTKNLFLEDTRL